MVTTNRFCNIVLMIAGLLTAVLAACDGGTGGGGEDDDSPGDSDAAVPGQADAAIQPGTCEPVSAETLATHVIAEVTWPATTGITAGSGTVHIWTRSAITYGAGGVTGSVYACGSVVPVLTASGIAGGGMILPEFPDAVWEASSMPSFAVAGENAGFDPGQTITLAPVASLIGASMADAENGPWPASGASLTAVDHDGNGKPGIDAVPRSDEPYRRPPLDLIGALQPNGPRADILYLAIRTVVSLGGVRDSCDQASGEATLLHFDNHVVGCHVFMGGECTPAQAKFVDDNRTVFQVVSASFTMKRVPDGASCADVRAALPAE